jgi:MtaA/CmuA family methyltransferase
MPDFDSKQRVLNLLSGQRVTPVPCFSGLASVTVAGLETAGLAFSQIHDDPERMAQAAETAFRAFGFESVAVPFDLGVEAGALGAEVDFHADTPYPIYPSVTQPLAASPAEFQVALPPRLAERGRVPVVVEAIRLLKQRVGGEVAVGAWIPGPYTLALQVVEMIEMVTAVAKQPEAVATVLDMLTGVAAEVGLAYRVAGADFLTIHEMGGSPGFIGPRAFEKLVQPALQRLMAALPGPRVLSVCGNTNRAMPLLADCGADALSVDQTNDLARSRETVGPGLLLFGNIDPVGTLSNGDEAEVRAAVRRAIEAGVDAVWPGCDLAPAAPAENLRAMVDEARR